MDILTGNAAELARLRQGWFLGHFMPRDPAVRESRLHSDQLELKWGEHAAGESRQQWSSNDATTISILLRGRFELRFAPERVVILQAPGDFALWLPGVLHTWRVLEDALILTARWPSRAGA